jgi:hypothetical protein
LQALAGFAHDSRAGTYTFRRPDTAVPFLADSGWGLWLQRGDELVMACTGGRLDLHRLTIVGGAAAYEASVDGTAVPGRCIEAGIEFRDGITLVTGQVLSLAAR